MGGRQPHSRSHVLPAHVQETRRRGAVARQAQPEDLIAPRVQCLSQCTQAVGRIRQAVQQQHPAHRRVGLELEAAVPIGITLPRVGQATGAVAYQTKLWPRTDRRVDLGLKLGEDRVLQGLVGLEVDHVGALDGELGAEPLRVPGLQSGATAALERQHDGDDEESDEAR